MGIWNWYIGLLGVGWGLLALLVFWDFKISEKPLEMEF